jgi:hypothetical protein
VDGALGAEPNENREEVKNREEVMGILRSMVSPSECRNHSQRRYVL